MMTNVRTGFVLLALLPAAGAAQAQFLPPPPAPAPTTPLKLKVGDATVFGTVSFTLMTTSNGDSLSVALTIGPLMASDKAIARKKAVAALAPWRTWQAVTSGAELTFQHQVAGVWQIVDSV